MVLGQAAVVDKATPQAAACDESIDRGSLGDAGSRGALSAVSVGPLDHAGPFLRPVSGDIWEQCQDIATAWRTAFRAALDLFSTGAEVLTSDAGAFPIVVSCKAWLPAPTATSTLRCAARLSFVPQPGKERPIQVTSSVEAFGRKFERIQELTTWDLREATATVPALIEYFVGRSSMPPDFYLRRWRLRDLFRKNRWVHVEREGGGGIQFVYFGMLIPLPPIQIVAVLVIVIHGFASFLQSLDRRTVVFDAGRPAVKPRRLSFMDSWYVVLPDLSGLRSDVSTEICAADSAAPGRPAGKAELEQIWHHSLDGMQARHQIVFRFRRAEVFVQVHEYGRDLYVGWNAYLNRGFWRECDLHEGRDSAGRRAVISTAVAGHLELTEYDVADANLLSEQVHGRVQAIVRRLAREHAIDQEIDFAPIRRNRSTVLTDAHRDAPGRDRRPSGRIERTA